MKVQAPCPTFFCEDFLTYRDAPKCTDEDICDFSDPNLLEKLKAIQPSSPLDVQGTIVAEETEVVVGDLPRGVCSGSFVGDENNNDDNNDEDNEDNEDEEDEDEDEDEEDEDDEDEDNEEDIDCRRKRNRKRLNWFKNLF